MVMLGIMYMLCHTVCWHADEARLEQCNKAFQGCLYGIREEHHAEHATPCQMLQCQQEDSCLVGQAWDDEDKAIG